MFFFARAYVKHLEREIEWYRRQLERERERADNAVDELLRLAPMPSGPITRPTLLPVPPSPEELDAARAADLELDAIGRA